MPLAIRLTRKWTFTHGNAIYGIAFSNDVQRVATASLDNLVKLWSVSDGRHTGTLKGHGDGVSFVAFLPDDRIVSASLDKTLKIWSAEGSVAANFTGHQDYLSCATVSRSGSIAVSGGHDKSVRVWNLQTGTAKGVLAGHDNTVQAVAISADGRWIASGGDDNSIRLWDVESESLVRKIDAHSGPVEALCFAPRPGILVSGGADGRLRIWKTDGTLVTDIDSRSSRVKCVSVSPDGRLLATGASDGFTRIWDVSNLPSCHEIHSERAHTNTVYSVTFSGDGSRFATASFDRRAHLFEAQVG